MQELTQKERIEASLKRIAPDVTEFDKKDFIQKYGFGTSTVSAYLNGKNITIDTGLKMLTFFREKIAEREKLIEGNG